MFDAGFLFKKMPYTENPIRAAALDQFRAAALDQLETPPWLALWGGPIVSLLCEKEYLKALDKVNQILAGSGFDGRFLLAYDVRPMNRREQRDKGIKGCPGRRDIMIPLKGKFLGLGSNPQSWFHLLRREINDLTWQFESNSVHCHRSLGMEAGVRDDRSFYEIEGTELRALEPGTTIDDVVVVALLPKDLLTGVKRGHLGVKVYRPAVEANEGPEPFFLSMIDGEQPHLALSRWERPDRLNTVSVYFHFEEIK